MRIFPGNLHNRHKLSTNQSHFNYHLFGKIHVTEQAHELQLADAYILLLRLRAGY